MKTSVRKQSVGRAGGFTLIEVTLAIIIVGLAIVALMMLFTNGTEVNLFGNDLSNGVFLADQMRSFTDEMNFDQLVANGTQSFASAVDAQGTPIIGMEQYRQDLTVRTVNPADMSTYIGPDPEAAVISAAISRHGQFITQVSWLRVR